MPWFGQELFEKAEANGGLDTKEYLDSLAEYRKGARDDGLDRVAAGRTGSMRWSRRPADRRG